MFFTKIENSEDAWNPEGVNGCTQESFVKNNPLAGKSIFNELDFNKDGYISESEWYTAQGIAGEDGIMTNQEKNNSCINHMKYFARRGIDKWFKVDKNRDGYSSNVEEKAWGIFNSNGKTLNGPLSNEELAKEYGMQEKIEEDMTKWIESEIEDIVKYAKEVYGVDLSEKQIIEIKKEQIKQLNTWLFKTGDNENSPFYQQLNLDAYTRLMSVHDGESCCGGDICEIPDFSPSNLEKNGKYTAQEMKARLVWAENSYLIDDEGKTVYNEKGCTIPTKIMTEKQVEMYKKMVESITKQPWDSEDWEITLEQFEGELAPLINGTAEDANLLEGKTRANIPENRQALLKFLEQKGWLLEQFK